ncbi:MAG: hypothetical protein LBT40_18005 [Deltaproteobacteria bacterium]|nr:hypothetical protein [Deltaproteobacteria bacterium]
MAPGLECRERRERREGRGVAVPGFGWAGQAPRKSEVAWSGDGSPGGLEPGGRE